MKRRIILAVLAAGLVTLAAAAEPLDTQTFALTAIDVVPTKDELDTALMGSGAGSQTPVQQLEALATGSAGSDTGVRLRAINVLPQYCPCSGSADPVRIAVQDVITQYGSALSGADVVVLRAAIESLGALRPTSTDDYTFLKPLLNHPSRDIRAATARAIAGLCNTTATNDLRVRYQNESTDQVKLAISATLRILSQPNCGQ